MKRLLPLVSLFFITLTCALTQAAPVIQVTGAMEKGRSLNGSMDLLEDPDGIFKIEDVVASQNFEQSGSKTPNFGFSKSVYWVRFQIKNSTQVDTLLLELGYPLLDYVSLYISNGVDEFRESVSGDMLPFSQRAREHRTITFELAQDSGSTKTYFLRIQTTSSVQIPLRVYTEASFGLMSSSENTMLGGYYGIFIVMILFNGLLWISLKDRIYGYYIFFLITYLLTQLGMNGNAHRFLLGDYPILSNKFVPISCFSVFYSISLFCRSFLDLAATEKRLSVAFIWVERWCIIFLLISTVVPYGLAVKFVALSAIVVPPGLIYAGIKRAIGGYGPARIYVVGWFSLLVGITIFSLKTAGLLDANIFTEYAMQVGSVFEVTFLSLALADRINVIKEQEAVAQKALLENYKVLADEYSNGEKLAQQNDKLKLEIAAASDQLIQADKLATLGSLAAGVAHDIASPTQLIQASVVQGRTNLARFEKRLASLVGSDSPEAIEVIKSFRVELNKGEQALKDVTLGANRIVAINGAIRNQSRADPHPSHFEVPVLLDECVTILGSKLTNVEVEVLCEKSLKAWGRRSHVGQVLTNLVSNAVDAASDNLDARPQARVRLLAESLDTGIMFTVIDSGKGVPQELRARVLEPFFTTKGVGKGTGLGMPICVRIIEAHGGVLSIGSNTELGGALLSFELPHSLVIGANQ